MTEVVDHPGVAAEGEVAERWNGLLAQDPAAGFFHTPRYLATWYASLGGNLTHRTKVVERDGTWLGVVPERIERVGTIEGPREIISFVGGMDVTDYLGPVSRPEHRDAVASAWITDLVEDGDWDELLLGGLAEDSGWPDAILRAAEAHGLHVLEDTREDVCPRVDLTGGHEGYLSRLPGKLRQEAKRKVRKLARDAGEVSLVEVPADQLGEALTRFFAFAEADDSAKGGFFSSVDMQDWFRQLASEFGPDRTLRLHELHVAGAPAAATVSFVHGREWGLYNSAFDQSLASLGAGMVLVGELIRVAAEDGCLVFDLLRGDEPYKYRFGAVDRPLRRITIVRQG